MGKILSLAWRPIKTFNIENRAHRFLDKKEPIRAPRFKADEESLRKVLEENPEIVESYAKKHIDLDNRLKDVYVTADKFNYGTQSKSERKLPMNRSQTAESEYGIEIPEIVPPGRLSLMNILTLLKEHKIDKKPIEELCVNYKIEKEMMDKLIRYHNILEMRFAKKVERGPDIPLEEFTYERLTGKPMSEFLKAKAKIQEKRKLLEEEHKRIDAKNRNLLKEEKN